MEEFEDALGIHFKLGDTVIVQSGDSLCVGVASHVSKAGNLIIYCVNREGRYTWNRLVLDYAIDFKLIVTRDPYHIHLTENTKIKGQ